MAVPFMAPGPAGVAIRAGLKGLTDQDGQVLRVVGDLLGSLASRGLKARCAAGLDHDSDRWAWRKRALTGECSSRWAGSITKATHDQWALARSGQLAYVQSLEAGRVRVVRGGRRLLRNRHNLQAARLTESEWRVRWEAERWFLQADGESGKRYGNETIRVISDGEVSIKLPARLAGLANASHGRYALACRVGFRHRGGQWADRIAADRAVAYRIHYDVARGRWYLTASWQIPPVRTMPLEAVRSGGLIGVDTNADHLAAWRLDAHGNPVGEPRRFDYDLSGSAPHRDAQVRHAFIRLLRWAERHGVAIAIEDLDFQAEKTRERYGRRKRFRQLISGMPTANPWGTRSGDGRHRPRITNGVSPARAKPRAWGRWCGVSDRPGRIGCPVCEETRPRVPGPRARSVGAGCGANAGDQRGHLPAVAGGAHNRSGHPAEHEFWH
ncbi:IS200/IS605 family accessory protein TnpB-related protein [Streptomyces sp. NPDC059850]|uniref:IS200/IS605 family accessory protein TnpB-related protein n=1 Tax=Streptomyces sp. NPDC059850 TaxID=3346970 RepID=UPI00364EC710